MKYLLLFVLISFPINAQIDNFYWLLGDWKMNTGNSYIIETWKQAGVNTIEGESFTYNSVNDSIIFKESLRLLNMDGDIFYVAKVSQNSLPIAFYMIFSDDKTIIFENGKHDYPQRIEYSKIAEDSLKVTISLILKDKSQRTFLYKKI